MIICILILICVSVQNLPTKKQKLATKTRHKTKPIRSNNERSSPIHVLCISNICFSRHRLDRWIQPMETAVISSPRKSEMQLCNSCSFIQIHWHLSSLEWDSWSKHGDATMCLQEYIPFIKESFCLNLRKIQYSERNICRATLVKWIDCLNSTSWKSGLMTLHPYIFQK